MGALRQGDLVFGGGIRRAILYSRRHGCGPAKNRSLQHRFHANSRHCAFGSRPGLRRRTRSRHDAARTRANRERALNWLDYPVIPVLTPDGTTLLFTDSSERAGNTYEVYVRKTDGSAPVRIAEGGYGSDITADGKWALVSMPDDPSDNIRVVPVGPGEPKVLHWDNFHPIWATWFPDGNHILIQANHSNEPVRVYISDRSGSVPKQLQENTSFPGVAPDGDSVVVFENKGMAIRSVKSGTTKPLPGIQPEELIIGWTSDSKHLFVQTVTATGADIYKVNVESGQRELWQALAPKDNVGLQPMNFPAAITPDGRWMVYIHRNYLGQLYRSDNMR
jgi:Tol biopolymer transport system component